jgi:Mg-chelatase subunit ChlD
MVVEPKNGGESCGSATETAPCNTGSCDRDCELHAWTEWSPCTQACDTGFQEKFRHIFRKSRAKGKCPKEKGHRRYRHQQCNEHKCYGDEQCVAKQDVILAIDGSGSLKEKGWAVLKNFTGELLKRYEARFRKDERMKVGVIKFGNGEILGEEGEERTISLPEVVSPITDKIDADLEKTVADMTWAKGFTNMAQAFLQSKSMFLNGGRKEAQSSLVVITDGLPSFKFQTEQAVHELRDGGVHVNIVTVRQHEGDETELMKSWVSYPKDTHYLHVPGVDSLQQQYKQYVTKAIVNFCPKSSSPTRREIMAQQRGWKKIRANHDCPNWWVHLGNFNDGMNCGAAAEAAGYTYYVFGGGWGWWKGVCFTHAEGGKSGECSWKNWWNGHTGFVGSIFDVYALVDGEGNVVSNEGFLLNQDDVDKKMMLAVDQSHDKRDERPHNLNDTPESRKFDDEGMTHEEFKLQLHQKVLSNPEKYPGFQNLVDRSAREPYTDAEEMEAKNEGLLPRF